MFAPYINITVLIFFSCCDCCVQGKFILAVDCCNGFVNGNGRDWLSVMVQGFAVAESLVWNDADKMTD